MRIGEIAAKAGVNVQTLRYYERRGLLEPPPRTPSGYRIYPMSTVKLVRFIKRVQELGFSLTDAEDLLSLREGLSPGDVQAIAESKLAGIRARIQDLQAMDAALSQVLSTESEELDALLIDAIDHP